MSRLRKVAPIENVQRYRNSRFRHREFFFIIYSYIIIYNYIPIPRDFIARSNRYCNGIILVIFENSKINLQILTRLLPTSREILSLLTRLHLYTSHLNG